MAGYISWASFSTLLQLGTATRCFLLPFFQLTEFGGADTTEANAQQSGERVPGGISHHAPQPAQHGGCQPPDHSCGLAHRVRAPLHL